MEWKKLRVFGAPIENSCPKNHKVLPSPTTQKLMLMLVCLLGKFADIEKNLSFCTRLQTFFTALRFLIWENNSFLMWNPLSLYILRAKNIKILASFPIIFSVDQKICRSINVPWTSSQGFLFVFSVRKQNVNKRQGINHLNLSKFHIPLRVQMNLLKMENTRINFIKHISNGFKKLTVNISASLDICEWSDLAVCSIPRSRKVSYTE